MTPNKKLWIVGGMLALAVIIIAFTFFYRGRKSGVDYKDVIEAKDETIRVLQEQRPIFEKHIDELKIVIAERKRNDSLLIVQINSTKQSIRQVDEKLKNIPARIAAIANNDDSIRSEFAKFRQ